MNSGMIKLSQEERAYALKIASAAYEAYELEKDAALMNIPFIKNFAGKVSEGTMDLWRRQHHMAMRAATPDMAKYHARLSDAAGKATGEGKVAIEGIQRIIHHLHGVGKTPSFNAQSYGQIGHNLTT